jgi:hypothetical protein
VCPRCGHAFVTRNLWHSCGQYDLEHHFEDRSPALRALFDRLRQTIESFGPVITEPQKTRIVFTVRVRFAGVIVRARSLHTHFWLTRPIEDGRFKIESFGPKVFVHSLHLTDPEQIDDTLVALLREAYGVGQQEHIAD